MKIVRENINEKFTEKSDPIEDMGIGVFTKKTFESPTAAAKHIYTNLELILGLDEIPGDVIYPLDYRNEEGIRLAFNTDYLPYIVDYLHKYVRPNTAEFLGRTLKQLNEILLMAHYPKTE